MDGRSDRSRALDGIRGLAALSVLVFHVWLYRTNRPMGERTLLFDQVGFALHLGLVCFFVLSGFLLYRAFARAALGGAPRVRVGGYAVRRVARIVPAYYLCIAGCLVLYALVGYHPITPSATQVPVFLLFGQNYFRDTLMQLDPVTWTLSVEAAFYVALPLIGLAALVAGRRPATQAALLLAVVLAAVAWGRIGVLEGWGPIAVKALPSFLGVFATGMLAALWLEARRAARRPALSGRATTLLAAAGFALVVVNAAWSESALWLDGWRPSLHDLIAASGFALIISAAAGGRGAVVRGLAWRPIAAAGVISYGIYLWHLPLLLVTRQAGLLPTAFVPRLAVVLGLSLLAGWISWRLVERPAIAWSHRRAGTERGPATGRLVADAAAP